MASSAADQLAGAAPADLLDPAFMASKLRNRRSAPAPAAPADEAPDPALALARLLDPSAAARDPRLRLPPTPRTAVERSLLLQELRRAVARVVAAPAAAAPPAPAPAAAPEGPARHKPVLSKPEDTLSATAVRMMLVLVELARADDPGVLGDVCAELTTLLTAMPSGTLAGLPAGSVEAATLDQIMALAAGAPDEPRAVALMLALGVQRRRVGDVLRGFAHGWPAADAAVVASAAAVQVPAALDAPKASAQLPASLAAPPGVLVRALAVAPDGAHLFIAAAAAGVLKLGTGVAGSVAGHVYARSAPTLRAADLAVGFGALLVLPPDDEGGDAEEPRLQALDLATLRALPELPAEAQPLAEWRPLALANGGHALWAARADGAAQFLPPGGELVRELKKTNEPLYTNGPQVGLGPKVFDVATKQWQETGGYSASTVAYDPVSNSLYGAGPDGRLQRWCNAGAPPTAALGDTPGLLAHLERLSQLYAPERGGLGRATKVQFQRRKHAGNDRFAVAFLPGGAIELQAIALQNCDKPALVFVSDELPDAAALEAYEHMSAFAVHDLVQLARPAAPNGAPVPCCVVDPQQQAKPVAPLQGLPRRGKFITLVGGGRGASVASITGAPAAADHVASLAVATEAADLAALVRLVEQETGEDHHRLTLLLRLLRVSAHCASPAVAAAAGIKTLRERVLDVVRATPHEPARRAALDLFVTALDVFVPARADQTALLAEKLQQFDSGTLPPADRAVLAALLARVQDVREVAALPLAADGPLCRALLKIAYEGARSKLQGAGAEGDDDDQQTTKVDVMPVLASVAKVLVSDEATVVGFACALFDQCERLLFDAARARAEGRDGARLLAGSVVTELLPFVAHSVSGAAAGLDALLQQCHRQLPEMARALHEATGVEGDETPATLVWPQASFRAPGAVALSLTFGGATALGPNGALQVRDGEGNVVGPDEWIASPAGRTLEVPGDSLTIERREPQAPGEERVGWGYRAVVTPRRRLPGLERVEEGLAALATVVVGQLMHGFRALPPVFERLPGALADEEGPQHEDLLRAAVEHHGGRLPDGPPQPLDAEAAARARLLLRLPVANATDGDLQQSLVAFVVRGPKPAARIEALLLARARHTADFALGCDLVCRLLQVPAPAERLGELLAGAAQALDRGTGADAVDPGPLVRALCDLLRALPAAEPLPPRTPEALGPADFVLVHPMLEPLRAPRPQPPALAQAAWRLLARAAARAAAPEPALLALVRERQADDEHAWALAQQLAAQFPAETAELTRDLLRGEGEGSEDYDEDEDDDDDEQTTDAVVLVGPHPLRIRPDRPGLVAPDSPLGLVWTLALWVCLDEEPAPARSSAGASGGPSVAVRRRTDEEAVNVGRVASNRPAGAVPFEYGAEPVRPDELVPLRMRRGARVLLAKGLAKDSPLLGEEQADAAWRQLGLFVDEMQRVAFAPADLRSRRQLRLGEWTHVALVQNLRSASLYLNGCLEAEAQLSQTLLSPGDASSQWEQVVESPHPYENNTNQSWTVSMPGARRITITWDPQTSTEATYDYVRIYRDDSHEAQWGGNFSGTSRERWTQLVVEADSFVVHFHSDGSNVDWGFRLIATGDMPLSDDDLAQHADTQLNPWPWHVGQPPPWVRGPPAAAGWLSDVRLFPGRALGPSSPEFGCAPGLPLVKTISGNASVDTRHACCTHDSFPTVVLDDCELREGCWYYEATVVHCTSVAQIGWVDASYVPDGHHASGSGVGDDGHSWAFDGARCLRWHAGSQPWGQRWRAGDVVGCFADLDRGVLGYSLNGSWDEPMGFAHEDIHVADYLRPAASFNALTVVQFNFGERPWAHAPPPGEWVARTRPVLEGRDNAPPLPADALRPPRVRAPERAEARLLQLLALAPERHDLAAVARLAHARRRALAVRVAAVRVLRALLPARAPADDLLAPAGPALAPGEAPRPVNPLPARPGRALVETLLMRVGARCVPAAAAPAALLRRCGARRERQPGERALEAAAAWHAMGAEWRGLLLALAEGSDEWREVVDDAAADALFLLGENDDDDWPARLLGAGALALLGGFTPALAPGARVRAVANVNVRPYAAGTNAAGYPARKGTTGRHYCGRRGRFCTCGRCDGRCGPTNGCNCGACQVLDRLEAAKSSHWSAVTGSVVDVDPGSGKARLMAAPDKPVRVRPEAVEQLVDLGRWEPSTQVLTALRQALEGLLGPDTDPLADALGGAVHKRAELDTTAAGEPPDEWEFSDPKAAAIAVWFDPRCELAADDVLVLQEDGAAEAEVAVISAGRFPVEPVVLRGQTKLSATLSLGGLGGAWGVRMVVASVTADARRERRRARLPLPRRLLRVQALQLLARRREPALLGLLPRVVRLARALPLPAGPGETSSSGKEVVVESAHPYDNGENRFWPVHVPGAKRLTLVFDPQTTTELNYDYVRIYKDESHSELWGESKYSGGRSGSTKHFPGIGSVPPLVIEGDSCVVHFKTDQSNVDWGFRAVFTPEMKAGAGAAGSSLGAGVQALSRALAQTRLLAYELPAQAALPPPSVRELRAGSAVALAVHAASLAAKGGDDDDESESEEDGEGADLVRGTDYDSEDDEAADRLRLPRPFRCVAEGGAPLLSAPRDGAPARGSLDQSTVKVVAMDGDFVQLEGGAWARRRQGDRVFFEPLLPEMSSAVAVAHRLQADEGQADEGEQPAAAAADWRDMPDSHRDLAELSRGDCKPALETALKGRGDRVAVAAGDVADALAARLARRALWAAEDLPADPGALLAMLRLCDAEQRRGVARVLARWGAEHPSVAALRSAGAQAVARAARWARKRGVKRTVKRTLESEHPYTDNYSNDWTLEVPGATELRISFDPQTATERNHDYVRFLKAPGSDERWGEDKYSGGRGNSSRCFPGLDGRPPLVIPASRVVVQFRTDRSNVDWGWKLECVGVTSTGTGTASKEPLDAEALRLGCWLLAELPGPVERRLLVHARQIVGRAPAEAAVPVARLVRALCKRELVGDAALALPSLAVVLRGAAEALAAGGGESLEAAAQDVNDVLLCRWAGAAAVLGQGDAPVVRGGDGPAVVGELLRDEPSRWRAYVTAVPAPGTAVAVGVTGAAAIEVRVDAGDVLDARFNPSSRALLVRRNGVRAGCRVLGEALHAEVDACVPGAELRLLGGVGPACGAPPLSSPADVPLLAAAANPLALHPGERVPVSVSRDTLVGGGVALDVRVLAAGLELVPTQGSAVQRLAGVSDEQLPSADSGMAVGDLVAPGPAWDWADGGALGVVEAISAWQGSPGAGVQVLWDSGARNVYRHGFRGCYDLRLVARRQAAGALRLHAPGALVRRVDGDAMPRAQLVPSSVVIETEAPAEAAQSEGPKVREDFFTMLSDMGFPGVRIERALVETNNEGVEQAMQVLLDRMDDPGMDVPIEGSRFAVAVAEGGDAADGGDGEPLPDVSSITVMGFPEGMARKALRRMGSLQLALDTLLEGGVSSGDDDDESPEGGLGLVPDAVPDAADADAADAVCVATAVPAFDVAAAAGFSREALRQAAQQVHAAAQRAGLSVSQTVSASTLVEPNEVERLRWPEADGAGVVRALGALVHAQSLTRLAGTDLSGCRDVLLPALKTHLFDRVVGETRAPPPDEGGQPPLVVLNYSSSSTPVFEQLFAQTHGLPDAAFRRQTPFVVLPLVAARPVSKVPTSLASLGHALTRIYSELHAPETSGVRLLERGGGGGGGGAANALGGDVFVPRREAGRQRLRFLGRLLGLVARQRNRARLAMLLQWPQELWAALVAEGEGDEAIRYVREGLAAVVPLWVLRVFTPEELEELVCGTRRLQARVLRSLAVCGEGIAKEAAPATQLWRCLERLQPREMAALRGRLGPGRFQLARVVDGGTDAPPVIERGALRLAVYSSESALFGLLVRQLLSSSESSDDAPVAPWFMGFEGVEESSEDGAAAASVSVEDEPEEEEEEEEQGGQRRISSFFTSSSRRRSSSSRARGRASAARSSIDDEFTFELPVQQPAAAAPAAADDPFASFTFDTGAQQQAPQVAVPAPQQAPSDDPFGGFSFDAGPPQQQTQSASVAMPPPPVPQQARGWDSHDSSGWGDVAAAAAPPPPVPSVDWTAETVQVSTAAASPRRRRGSETSESSTGSDSSDGGGGGLFGGSDSDSSY